ncbi:guanylate kinase [Loigolactobacillus backii]|uniref:guanylate kinase n=1 Tax=Loigolactobacillus backii TaxID=375175 RepID=UPI000C1CAD41|nr:guanylate kinase [Loigolactobacillus backii]PIO84053.1 guanylate kinase [Loigolactobacillus backii]
MTGQRLFVITGATGSGKTTVSHYLSQAYNIPRVVTHTTRPPRHAETNGVDYYFETPTTFAMNHFIERVTYADYSYGSSHEGLAKAWQKNNFASIVLDTKGAATYVKTLGTRVVLIYLMVDDPKVLVKRLSQRGDNTKMIAQRLASQEYRRDLIIPVALKKAAHVIINDDWQQAKQQTDHLMTQIKQEVVAD